jgi:hypothetical protein
MVSCSVALLKFSSLSSFSNSGFTVDLHYQSGDFHSALPDQPLKLRALPYHFARSAL